MIRSVALAAAFAAAIPSTVALAAGDGDRAPPRALSVTGFGEARAAPDMARAVIGVSLRRPGAAEAAGAAAEAMGAVLTALRGAGVAETDLRTVDIQLAPVWVWDEQGQRNRQEGYEARHMAEATLRDLAALGPALDAAARAGATEFGGVTFDLEDRAAVEDAARRAAVADARRIAAVAAEAAGVTLGAPLSIAVGGPSWPGPMMMRADAPMAEAAAAPTPVAPGELTLSATVSVTYAME
jgi:uncharacterized protein YggE